MKALVSAKMPLPPLSRMIVSSTIISPLECRVHDAVDGHIRNDTAFDPQSKSLLQDDAVVTALPIDGEAAQHDIGFGGVDRDSVTGDDGNAGVDSIRRNQRYGLGDRHRVRSRQSQGQSLRPCLPRPRPPRRIRGTEMPASTDSHHCHAEDTNVRCGLVAPAVETKAAISMPQVTAIRRWVMMGVLPG